LGTKFSLHDQIDSIYFRMHFMHTFPINTTLPW